MADSNQFNLSDHDYATKELSNSLISRIEYLKVLNDAIDEQDDRLVYQLIDGQRYSKEILKAKHSVADIENESLILDVHDKISAFLSKKLITYLREMYPFFYFEEIGVGRFQFYFGNWWGRRLFGELDVLNVEFKFNAEEYEKLSRAFELEVENKRYNTDEINKISEETDSLQELIDGQDSRDQRKDEIRKELKRQSQEKVSFWEQSKQKEQRQKLMSELSKLTDLDEAANNAYQKIRENEEKVLNLSKEDTLLGYEKQSIITKFGTFENFIDHNNPLYRDYIADLIARKGRVD